MKTVKRIAIVMIAVLLASLLGFTVIGCEKKPKETIREYQGKEITKLTYRSVDYNGGVTDEYSFDFRENTASKRWYIPYSENGVPEFENFASFTDEKETVFINKCYTYGLFSLEERYEHTGHIDDGGGWDLTVEYADGTSKSSSGDNAAPGTVFGKCKYAFYDICQDGVVGYIPDSYFYPPYFDYTFRYPYPEGNSTASYNGFADATRGNYRWNGFEVSDVSYFEINQDLAKKNTFLDGVEYTFIFEIQNYGIYEDVEKFSKLTLTCYDFNEEMTNKTEVLSTTFFCLSHYWLSPKSPVLEMNKIYICRLTWKNGDYAEYTFNTYINDIVENA